VQAERELDDTEIRREVAAGSRDGLYKHLADLVCERGELGVIEGLQVRRPGYRVKKGMLAHLV
jgi:hypothetical protein